MRVAEAQRQDMMSPPKPGAADTPADICALY